MKRGPDEGRPSRRTTPYDDPGGYDEAIGASGVREAYRDAFDYFATMTPRESGRLRSLTDLAFRNQDITHAFTPAT